MVLVTWLVIVLVLDVTWQVWSRHRKYRCADCGSNRRIRRCLYCRRRVCRRCRDRHHSRAHRYSGWCVTSWARVDGIEV